MRGTSDQGIGDPNLWGLALAESRTLITTDKGFTVVRPRRPNRHKIHYAVMNAIERFPEAEWPNLLVVVRDSTMSTSRMGGERS